MEFIRENWDIIVKVFACIGAVVTLLTLIAIITTPFVNLANKLNEIKSNVDEIDKRLDDEKS